MKVTFCNLLIIGLWLSHCGIAKQGHQEGAGTPDPKTIAGRNLPPNVYLRIRQLNAANY